MPKILKDFLLGASFQGVTRLFVLAFNNTNDANKVERDSHSKSKTKYHQLPFFQE